jgi:2-dehydropantoate 2-reductase
VKFSETGYNVSIFARSKRLLELKEKGLLYKKDNKILKANVHIILELLKDDKYDFVFVAVRFE